MIVLTCFNCGHKIELNGRVQYNATCDKCASYLKCCLNCKFYDPGAYNQCHESSADRVKDKGKSNFCDFFDAGSSTFKANTRKDDSLKKLNDLFKKKN